MWWHSLVMEFWRDIDRKEIQGAVGVMVNEDEPNVQNRSPIVKHYCRQLHLDVLNGNFPSSPSE